MNKRVSDTNAIQCSLVTSIISGEMGNEADYRIKITPDVNYHNKSSKFKHLQ